ncbi:OmpH family outer membrane protein [Oceanicola sp. D3]|uniref:OmpH family outer membrane protein n=1 Tax=Oceanicola sp. D3 TaxID=2587163 RepID=UPI00143CD79C|nr:OmpH family outer membrane protein [Oceanicola sp. D3]
MRGLAAVVALCLGLAPVASIGQQAGATPSSVLTIDQERLFQTTLLGQRLQRELNEARSDLIAENARIQEDLEAEEASLTEQRAEMDPDAFRELADAFDEKVTAIRAEQEGKTRQLQRLQDRNQQIFNAAIGPVVKEVVEERGAAVILDSRAILLAISDIDVTDLVRMRVDRLLGDGGEIAVPPLPPEDDTEQTSEGDGSEAPTEEEGQ